MGKQKCLWTAVATGECITEKKVDESIANACSWANNKLEKRWLGHPMFKKTLLSEGKREEAYPSTLIEGSLLSADKQDMLSDLKMWNKKSKR